MNDLKNNWKKHLKILGGITLFFVGALLFLQMIPQANPLMLLTKYGEFINQMLEKRDWFFIPFLFLTFGTGPILMDMGVRIFSRNYFGEEIELFMNYSPLKK